MNRPRIYRYAAIDRSLLDNMSMPTFVDLQGFIVNKKFIVKEVAVLKQGTILTYYIFTSPVELFDKIRQVLRFLVECLSSWIAMGGRDGSVQRGETSDHDSCI